jgi:ubiquinone/menaquinone biosynthesis C-methylase UbiE
MAAPSDRWSRWLLERRDAGSESQRAVALEHLAGVRDRLLALTEPLAGATLLDVGTGDGLIGRAALRRVGPHGRVIFSDISAALLDAAREAAHDDPRASFVPTSAETLGEIPDGSVDVVTTRSVLIYVADKAAALRAMRRVLRPDGRIALFEPINRRMFPEPADRLWGYDVAAVADLAGAVKARYRDDRDPAAAAMMDFDELDLLRLAQEAGFTRLHLECHTDVEPAAHMRAIDLDTLLDMSPNPTAPTLREALADALGPVHRERFLAHMQAAVAGETTPVRRSVVAYLAARRSG